MIGGNQETKWVKSSEGGWIVKNEQEGIKSKPNQKTQQLDNRSAAQKMQDSLIQNPNYIDEITGKNSLHFFIDYASSSSFNAKQFDISKAIRSICDSNSRALLQLEYQNRYTPLAYLFACTAMRLAIKESIMFEFLIYGASLEYVTRFEDAMNSSIKLFLPEWVMNSELNKVRAVICIGKGAQRIGALSKTLPSHLTNLIARSGTLHPKDFDVCFKKIVDEQAEAAKVEKETSSWSFGSYIYPFKESEEEKIHAELENKIAKESALVSANLFFEKEVAALYRICNTKSFSEEKKEDSPCASASMIWLAGLNTGQGLNTLQFLQKENQLSSETVYLVDKLLRTGLSFKAANAL